MKKTFYRLINIFTALLMVAMVVTVSPPPAVAAAPIVHPVDFVILPASQTATLGQPFSVTVQVQAGANVVDGISICVDFNPAVLQFNSFTLPAPNPWDMDLLTATHDPATGKADQSRATFGAGASGTVTFVTLNFTALAVTASTPLSFHTADTRVTSVSVALTEGIPTNATGATVAVSPGTLQSITVTPANPTITLGQTQQFSANGTYTAGWMDITNSVTWNSSNNGTATINAAGLATSVAAGTTGITASKDAITSAPVSTLTVINGAVDHITISPDTATITADQTQAYTAMAYNAVGGSWSITSGTTFTISGGAGGSWATNVYTPQTAGAWTVTGTHTASGQTDTAALTVNNGAVNTLTIAGPASTDANTNATFTATAVDRGGNDLGNVTAGTTFTISAGAGGSWALNVYTPHTAGSWTVTGTHTASGKTDTAPLTVTHGIATVLTIAGPASITTDDTATFTATASDAKANSWNVTSLTAFSIDAGAGGTWTDNVYDPLHVGDWTVQGDYLALSDTTPLTVAGGSVDHIVISPPSATITADGTQAFTVQAYDSGGVEHWDVTAGTTFSINGTAGGSWTGATYTAAKAGTWTVTATYLGKSSTANLTVNFGALHHIIISPDTATITADNTTAYTAEAFDQDNNSRGDVTGTTTFSIVQTPADGGSFTGATYTAVKTGTWTVQGTLTGKTDTAILTVTNGALHHIVMLPAASTITADNTQAYTVEAFDLDNNSRGGVTAATAFSIQAGAGGSWVANIYTPQTAGVWTVTANYTGKLTTSTLTVNVGVLHHITVSPATASVNAGSTTDFAATGYDQRNNSRGAVTNSSVWTSTNPGIASIESIGQTNPGRAKGFNPGTVTITAASGGIIGTASLTVNAATLSDLVISPAGPTTITVNATQQYRVTAVYSNGSKVDVTGSANWTSGTEAVASIGLHTGTATGLTAGSSVITAWYNGMTGTSTLNVINVPLVSIAVTPAVSLTINAGETQQFIATGNFSGTYVVITEKVTWTSSNPAVARIMASGGLATSYASGTATITATMDSINGTAVLTVNPKVITSVKVTPASPAVTFVSGNPATIQFTATVVYSDGSTSDNTTTAAWTVPVGPLFASVDAAGLVTTIGPGTATIRATVSGVIGNATLTINADSVAPVVEVNQPAKAQTVTTTTLTVTGRVDDKNATATVWVNGISVALLVLNPVDGTFSENVTLVDGSNTVEVRAVDGAANTGTSGTKVVKVDAVKPTLIITSPVEGSVTKQTSVTVEGTVTGATSATLRVNGVAVATVGSGAFSRSVTLQEGANNIILSGYGIGGATAAFLGTSGTRTVIKDSTPPVVEIKTPAAGSLVNVPGVTVMGTVNDPSVTTATLSLNGAPQAIPVANGVFSQAVVLAAGINIISVTATDSALNTSTAVLMTVTYDNTKPVVTVTAPANNLRTNQGGQLVTGNVNDLSIRTASLIINGISQTVSVDLAGQFTQMASLNAGANTIIVTARDGAGNTGSSGTVNVIVDSTAPNLIIELSDPTTSVQITVFSNEELAAAPVVNVGGAIAMSPAGVNKWTGVFETVVAGTDYTVTATGNDRAGNTGTASATFTREAVTIAAGTPGTVTTSDTTLVIDTTTDVAAQSISVTTSLENPAENTASGGSAGIFLEITASGNLTDSIESVYIQVDYDEDEVRAMGLDESTLKLYVYNESTGLWEVLPGSASNVTGNYVYGTVTHLSKFGTFGNALPVTPTAPVAGGGVVVTTVTLTGLSGDTLKVNSQGTVQTTTKLTSADNKAWFDIVADTKVLDADGKALATLTAEVIAAPTGAPAGTAILGAYSFGPSGATFNPGITLTMTYDQATIPGGMDESKLYISYWDGSKWVALPSVVDTVANKVTATVTHFTNFAVMGAVKKAEVVIPVTPTPKPAAFTLSNLTITPSSVETGKLVTIKVVVANTGEASGTYTVTLNLNGAAAESRDVTLNGGTTETVTFTTSKNTAGTYTVSVGTLTGSFTVTKPVVVVPEKEKEEEEVIEPTGGMAGWVWVIIILVVIAVAAAIYWWMRRRKTA